MKMKYTLTGRHQKIEKLKELSSSLRFEITKKDSASRLHIPRLVQKIKTLLAELRQLVSAVELKRILGPACVMFGMAFTNSASAQTFAAPVANPFGLVPAANIAAPAIVDLDGDGDLDIMAGEYGGNFQFFRNVGTAAAPSFTTPVQNGFGLTVVNYYAFPAFADLDGDGDKDLLSGEYGGNLQYFQNKGTATAPSFTTVVQNPFGLSGVSMISFPTLVDLDNDGDLDLMVGEYGGSFQYFQNTGTSTAPAFAASVSNPFGLTATYNFAAPNFTDLDGDGDKDLISGDGNGNLQYFQNTGTASAPAFAAPVTNPFSLTAVASIALPAFADLDNDGDKDLMVGEYGGSFQYFQQVVLTGVASVSADNGSIRVFPNPTAGELHVGGDLKSVEKIEVMDVSGRVCATYPADTRVISLNGFDSGLYMVKISCAGGRTELKKVQKL